MSEILQVTVQLYNQDESQLLTLLPALHVSFTQTLCVLTIAASTAEPWLSMLSDVVLIYSLQWWLDHTVVRVILCQV